MHMKSKSDLIPGKFAKNMGIATNGKGQSPTLTKDGLHGNHIFASKIEFQPLCSDTDAPWQEERVILPRCTRSG